MTTLFHKIPPSLPLPAPGRENTPKGGTVIPLFDKEGLALLDRASLVQQGRMPTYLTGWGEICDACQSNLESLNKNEGGHGQSDE